MPRYGDGSPYHFGTSFSNHSSLMTTTGSGRLHGPFVSRYSPHLSTISESPLSHLRRYSPIIATSPRPKRVDTADIDVSTPRNLSHTDHGRSRVRRDRPTIRIRSQALKDNPALRELNEKHEKTVGELLVEKFFIREKTGADPIKMVRAYHQPSLERGENEAMQKKVTRRFTRRRSSLEIPTDSEIIAREVIIAQAQAEALDTLVEQEQAQIEVEARKGTLVNRRMSRDLVTPSIQSSENEQDDLMEGERPASLKKTIKKIKKKKKILDNSLPQSDDVEETLVEKSQPLKKKSGNNLIPKSQSSAELGEERQRIRPQKFKIEASNSVGDFSTLWINASSTPSSPVPSEQYQESIRLPAPKSIRDSLLILPVDDDDQSQNEDNTVVLALPKLYVKDTSRNSVCLTLKPATPPTTPQIVPRTREFDNSEKSTLENSSGELLVNSRHLEKRSDKVNALIEPMSIPKYSETIEKSEKNGTRVQKDIEKSSHTVEKLKAAEEKLKTTTKISDTISKRPKFPIKKSDSQTKDENSVTVEKLEKNTTSTLKDVERFSVAVEEKSKISDTITKRPKIPVTKSDSETKEEKLVITEKSENNTNVLKDVEKSPDAAKKVKDVTINNVEGNAKIATKISDTISKHPKIPIKKSDSETEEEKSVIMEKSEKNTIVLNDVEKSLNAAEEVNGIKINNVKEKSKPTTDISNNIFKSPKISLKKSESQNNDEKCGILKKSEKNTTSILKNVEEPSNAVEEVNTVLVKNGVEKTKNSTEITNNISKRPKIPVKKSSSQIKDVSLTKKAERNIVEPPKVISEASIEPIETDIVTVTETIIERSVNHVHEPSESSREIVEVGTSSDTTKISENLPPKQTISEVKNVSGSGAPDMSMAEVDFWGEIKPKDSPIASELKSPQRTNDYFSTNISVIPADETVDRTDEKLLETVVESSPIKYDTDLNENSIGEKTLQITTGEISEEDKKDGDVLSTDVSMSINSSLSIPLDDEVSEINKPLDDNVWAKDQDSSTVEKLEAEGNSELSKTPANNNTDNAIDPPLPSAVEETAINCQSEPPLPTITIVAAPPSPEPSSIESKPDEGSTTPTNEWPNVTLSMSKWESQNDLSDDGEDREATPTPPSGEDLSISPRLSKKKKVAKKKKSVSKKSDSEDNGSVDNNKESDKLIPEVSKSLKPLSPLNSPRCSPHSSPRDSPKQKERPLDLIKMFYTTPGPLLTATPRDLSKVRRGGKRRKRPVSIASSASDSTESTRSSQSTTTTESTEDSSTCSPGAEEAKDDKRLTSTRSNDSGFDGSPRLTNCDMACHKKCEKLTGNLCGLNQKLVAEALQDLKRAPSQSSDSQRSEKNSRFTSGRITPPATNLPRFKKYAVTDFNFLKVLGKGSFGKVLLAELRDTDCLYAVKCLKKDVVLEDDDVECTLIERKVLTLATRHPYLCHLFCTFQTDSHLFFVMEYLNGGDLMFHIQRAGRFSEPRARFYAAEILSGLNFLHKKGIVYRDLKLDNVLLDFDGHIRIADFGMCKLQIYLDRTADTFCGTPDYMAPEIIKGLKYNQAVDWWSFGVLLYEMLTGQSPFSGCDEDELFWSICNERPFIPRYLSQESTDILVCVLEKDAGKRLPGHEIAVHPFFQGISWDRLERRQLEPPFKPALEHTLDTRYFDATFTSERPRLSIVPEQILISMDQEVFRGFSYTNPNATD